MGAVIVLIYFELRCHEEPWSSSWLKTTADVDVEDGTLNIMDHWSCPRDKYLCCWIFPIN